MVKKRRHHTAQFKLKAVLEILKGEKTASQLAGELEVHPMALSEWKRQFLERGAEIFEKVGKKSTSKNDEKEKAELYEQIGRLKMENEWFKKKLSPLI
jgi:transposase